MKERKGTRHRFFLIPFQRKGDELCIRDEEHLHQITKVLRMRVDDLCEVLDNEGGVYTVRLTLVSRKEVRGTIVEERREALPDRKVVLCFGLLKGSRNEYIVEKATELGVTDFQPVLFERCQPFPLSPNKLRRFEAIMKEATEQSEGLVLPRFHEPCSLADLLEEGRLPSVKLLVWENADGNEQSQGRDHQDVALFVGPEGGITAEEAAQLQESGAQMVSLGTRILRAETAVVAALARFVIY